MSNVFHFLISGEERKPSLRMVLMLLCLLISLPGWAQREFEDSSNGLYYLLDDEHLTAELAYAYYDGSDCVIPASLQVDGKSYKVVKLGNRCLMGSRFTSVALPSTIEEVGDSAFCNSGLKGIYLNEGLRKIGKVAFANCYDLQNVTISSTVTEIGEYAFYGIWDLSSFTLEMKSSTPVRATGELFDDPEYYSLAKLIVPSGSEEAYQRDDTWGKFFMTDYQEAATGLKYRLNALTKTAMLVRNLGGGSGSVYTNNEYVIPSTIKDENGEEYKVTELGMGCFAGSYAYGQRFPNTTLERVVLPNTIRKVGAYAFYQCSNLKSVQLPEDLQSLPEYCFSSCGNLVSIDLPVGLQTLGVYCFNECTSLQSVDVPSRVTVLSAYAFAGCSALQKVTLPASLRKLEYGCFNDCSSLKEITIPESVKEMEWIFYHTNLQTLICQAKTPPTFSEDNLFSCNQNFSTCKLIVPEGSEEAYRKAVVWERFFRMYQQDSDNGLTYELRPETQTAILLRGDANDMVNCVVSESRVQDGVVYPVTELEPVCFYNCNQLESVSLPSSVEELPYGAFLCCGNLRQAQLPAQLKKLGNGCFSECLNLKQVQLPDQLKELDRNCFSSSGIEEITLPQSLEKIWDSCFENCNQLVSVSLPSSIVELPKNAFKDCSNLKEVQLPAQLKKLGSGCFMRCSNLKEVQLPNQLKELGESCFMRTGIEEISLPQSLEKIGVNCFSSTLLKTIVIPASVKTIGTYGLGARSLQSIYCEGEEPAVATSIIGDSKIWYSKITLYVPTGSVSRYQASEEWSKFTHIQEYTPTSIAGVRSDATSTVAPVYTIDGKKVSADTKSLPKGIYVSGGKKMVIK